MREADVDGDAAALLFFQAVGVDAGKGLDQRGLAVIDVPGGADDDGLHSGQYSRYAARAPARCNCGPRHCSSRLDAGAGAGSTYATIEVPHMTSSSTLPLLPRSSGSTASRRTNTKRSSNCSADASPPLTELGIFSVMWSEHCSYKSSRVHLKRLPTRSKLVVQGPGENAGIIDIGDGWACAFKIESHNHPSFIEPFQGAATGVGGILRDIFTMGARPVAVMDSLRFGPIESAGTGGADGGIRHASGTRFTRTIPCWKAWSAASLRTETALACPTWAARPSSSLATRAIRW